ncbi:MAG TPA: prepilin-type N-terminal cleavage/methylation domain-containing protein [Myxococcaceae bacterium]|jgi:general secretion pathway protein I
MRRNRGFTLLETVIALAILALALMAIFDLNSGALANHVYSKHLTIATLLARSKMTDLEQQLYDDGFSNDDDEESGDFSEEGWPSFKWRAKIIAPKLDGVSPDQVIGAIFNLPMGGEGGDLDGLASMFGGSAGGQSGGPVPAGGGMAGMAAGMMQPMMTQMVQQLTQTVREVHLTVTWKQGTVVESMDVVTHIVSLGPGSDRNGGGIANPGGGGPGGGGPGGGGAAQWVDAQTGLPVQNVVPGPNGQMVDAATQRPVMNGQAWLNQSRNSGAGNPLGNPFNNRGRTNQ